MVNINYKAILGVLLASSLLTGCIAYKPVKYAVDEVCESSDSRKVVLAEEFDKATFPHKLRVQCYKPTPTITGDKE